MTVGELREFLGRYHGDVEIFASLDNPSKTIKSFVLFYEFDKNQLILSPVFKRKEIEIPVKETT